MHVVNVIFDDRYAGPSNRVIQVAAKLSDYGVETVLCIPEGDGNAEDIARQQGVPVRRVAFERIPRPSDLRRVARWTLRLPRDVSRFIKFFREERPDAVHVNGAFFLPPAVAAKLARIPLVWHLNDTAIPSRVAPIFGFLVRALADGIVTSAESVAEHYGVDLDWHEVIYAPVDTERFEAAGRTLRSGGMGETVRVGLVANWNPMKGVEYFVRAAARVRELLGNDKRLEVVFCGARLGTHEEYARLVDSLIEEQGLRPVVREYGFVSSMAPVLEGLDLLVSSSITEAAAQTAVIEGMASGLPIVVTDVGGVREMLGEGAEGKAGIVVPPKDPEAMAVAVVHLLNSPDEAARMGQNGRRLAEKRFSLDNSVRKHLKVYTTLPGVGKDEG